MAKTGAESGAGGEEGQAERLAWLPLAAILAFAVIIGFVVSRGRKRGSSAQ
jgi:hypothetical protein